MKTKTFLLVPAEEVNALEDLLGALARALLAVRGETRGSVTLEIGTDSEPGRAFPQLSRTTLEDLANLF